jgi:ketosteroid isomerase-like protein
MAPSDSAPRVRVDEVDAQFAARFAEQFAETWRTPDLAKHEALWSEDIVLTQPMMGTLRGKQACRESFQRLFALIPDLHADVHRVGHGTHEVFIEFTLSGTYGAKPIAWDAVDRFTFNKGLIAERVSFFDSAPLMLKLVGRPSGWERLVRTGSQLFRR